MGGCLDGGGDPGLGMGCGGAGDVSTHASGAALTAPRRSAGVVVVPAPCRSLCTCIQQVVDDVDRFAGAAALKLRADARRPERRLPLRPAATYYSTAREIDVCSVRKRKKRKKKRCTSRESNPGLYRGRVLFYH